MLTNGIEQARQHGMCALIEMAIHNGGLTLGPEGWQALWRGTEVVLTASEFQNAAHANGVPVQGVQPRCGH